MSANKQWLLASLNCFFQTSYAFINYLMRDDVARNIVESYPYISPIKNTSDINESEIEMIFSKGSYVKNLSKEETKRLDHLWAEYK
jgi:spermidine/putrescine-binding protein